MSIPKYITDLIDKIRITKEIYNDSEKLHGIIHEFCKKCSNLTELKNIHNQIMDDSNSAFAIRFKEFMNCKSNGGSSSLTNRKSRRKSNSRSSSRTTRSNRMVGGDPTAAVYWGVGLVIGVLYIIFKQMPDEIEYRASEYEARRKELYPNARQ